MPDLRRPKSWVGKALVRKINSKIVTGVTHGQAEAMLWVSWLLLNNTHIVRVQPWLSPPSHIPNFTPLC